MTEINIYSNKEHIPAIDSEQIFKTTGQVKQKEAVTCFKITALFQSIFAFVSSFLKSILCCFTVTELTTSSSPILDQTQKLAQGVLTKDQKNEQLKANFLKLKDDILNITTMIEFTKQKQDSTQEEISILEKKIDKLTIEIEDLDVAISQTEAKMKTQICEREKIDKIENKVEREKQIKEFEEIHLMFDEHISQMKNIIQIEIQRSSEQKNECSLLKINLLELQNNLQKFKMIIQSLESQKKTLEVDVGNVKKLPGGVPKLKLSAVEAPQIKANKKNDSFQNKENIDPVKSSHLPQTKIQVQAPVSEKSFDKTSEPKHLTTKLLKECFKTFKISVPHDFDFDLGGTIKLTSPMYIYLPDNDSGERRCYIFGADNNEKSTGGITYSVDPIDGTISFKNGFTSYEVKKNDYGTFNIFSEIEGIKFGKSEDDIVFLAKVDLYQMLGWGKYAFGRQLAIDNFKNEVENIKENPKNNQQITFETKPYNKSDLNKKWNSHVQLKSLKEFGK